MSAHSALRARAHLIQRYLVFIVYMLPFEYVLDASWIFKQHHNLREARRNAPGSRVVGVLRRVLGVLADINGAG